MNTNLTLQIVRDLATRYVPRVATWYGNMNERWGPAHEIAHLLVAKRVHLSRRNFGLNVAATPPSFKGMVYEMSASIVHTWILVACGKEGIAEANKTWAAEEHLPEFMMNKKWVKMKPYAYSLLKKRRLTKRSVQTHEALERSCRRACCLPEQMMR